MSEVTAGVRLELTDIAVGVPSEEAQAEGANPGMEVTFKLGLSLPFMNPQTQKPIITPLGEFSVGLNKEEAIAYSETIAEAAALLPDTKRKSEVLIANNLEAVEQAVEQLDRAIGRKT